MKSKCIKAEWCVGSPIGTMIRASDNGWINSDIFLEWAKEFVKFIPNKHVLLLDGHGSHVYNLEFLKLMDDSGIEVICFPSHTTHWLQPADKSFFKSLKHHWNVAGTDFMREFGGRRPTKNDFFSLFTPAWKKATTVSTAQSAFRATGMFPIDKSIIPESAYSPSFTILNYFK